MAVVEIMEAKFKSRCLLAKVAIRTSEFIRDEEMILVKDILKRASNDLATIDTIADLVNERNAKMAHDVIAKILNAQREVAVQIALGELGKVDNERL